MTALWCICRDPQFTDNPAHQAYPFAHLPHFGRLLCFRKRMKWTLLTILKLAWLP